MSLQRLNELKSIIELDKALGKVAKHCFSDYGKEALMNLEPFETNYLQRLRRSAELYKLILKYGEPPLYGVLNLRAEIQQAQNGTILSGKQLSKIAKTLNAICQIKQYFVQYSEDIPELWTLLSALNCEKNLIGAINHAINEEGEVVDKASPLLREIRNELKQLNRTLRSKLDSVISNYRSELTDSIVLTREGRYVLPLIASRKTLYDGIIHGSSSSGATVYFEPKELVPLNNRFRVLKSSEEEEVRRILRGLTTKFFEAVERLERDLYIISELDVSNASAMYAKKHRASFIFPYHGKSMALLKARHPLIDDDKVVPIDFSMPEEVGAVVITGPNTGGKTVALKTIGLCVLMAMCGLPVLAEDSSKIPEFKNVFIDVGDEQSIEQSLSTFSSHISRIIEVINSCDENSLVLLDELGAGTDPVEGAALSMAIIDTLLNKKTKTIVSTHLSPLKIYALKKSEVMNASVEFDVDTLRPTYHLIMGIPGSSNALEISRRLGLPIDVMEKAKKYMSSESANFEILISELHKERSKIEIIKRELIEEKQRLQKLKESYDERFEKLKEKRLGELDRELKELEEKLSTLMKKIEKSISLSRSEKEEDKIKAVKELYKAKEALQEMPMHRLAENISIEAGDSVKILDTGVLAKVVSVKEGKALLKAGIMTLEVPLSKLEKVELSQKDEEEKRYSVISNVQRSSSELDIRGIATDDVPFVIDDFLDSLVRANRSKGYIIHGKGTGKLGDAVWKYLRRNKIVKRFRIGTPKEGGHGVTIVEV